MATTLPVFTQGQHVSDFLKWFVDERYCMLAATIKNVTGVTVAAGAIVPGTPLKLNGSQWETTDAADAGTVDGFYVDQRRHESLVDDAITAKRYAILVRGPALINKNAIPVNDLTVTPDPYTLATIVTQAATLGIQCLAEAATVETQTT